MACGMERVTNFAVLIMFRREVLDRRLPGRLEYTSVLRRCTIVYRTHSGWEVTKGSLPGMSN